MLTKLLDKLLGQAGRAGDLGWDADMLLVMPARGACAARTSSPLPHNVVTLAARRRPAAAAAQPANRRATV